MGRKKIQIQRITDERNRQVRLRCGRVAKVCTNAIVVVVVIVDSLYKIGEKDGALFL